MRTFYNIGVFYLLYLQILRFKFSYIKDHAINIFQVMKYYLDRNWFAIFTVYFGFVD